MSSTRNKLKRLFKKPSSGSSVAFAPRDLDRTPREFDEDGHAIERSENIPSEHIPSEPVQSSHPSAPRSGASSYRPPTHRPSRTDSPSAPAPSPPPSKAGDDERARPQTHHTAPWAASAAFDSWKAQRGPKDASTTRSSAAPKSTPTLGASSARPSTPTPDAASSSHKSAQNAGKLADKTSRRTSTPDTTRRSPPGHVHRVGHDERTTHVGMQASRDFSQWKQRKAQPPAPQDSTTNTNTRLSSRSKRTTGASADTPRTDIQAQTTRAASDEKKAIPPKKPLPKKPLPDDRVRRRAIRSREAFLPDHARQYDLGATEAPSAQQFPRPSPSKAAAGQDDPKTKTSSSTRKRTLTMRATEAPTAQTPAERLMWVSAHQHELSDAHIVSTLSALEGAALRAGHQARRFRMLSESLLRLERNDEALQNLRALQKIVPHDAWTLLRLAETCAMRADTMEEGLRWCEDALRLHPWLSQAQTLRDDIEARLQTLN